MISGGTEVGKVLPQCSWDFFLGDRILLDSDLPVPIMLILLTWKARGLITKWTYIQVSNCPKPWVICEKHRGIYYPVTWGFRHKPFQDPYKPIRISLKTCMSLVDEWLPFAASFRVKNQGVGTDLPKISGCKQQLSSGSTIRTLLNGKINPKD